MNNKKRLIAFCKWSKEAEWRDGTKQMFIKNDWENYIAEFDKYYSETYNTEQK